MGDIVYYRVPKPFIDRKTGVASIWLERDIYDEEAGKRLGCIGEAAKVMGLFVASADMMRNIEERYKKVKCLVRLSKNFYVQKDGRNVKWHPSLKQVRECTRLLVREGYIVMVLGDRIKGETTSFQITDKFREFLALGPLTYSDRRIDNQIIIRNSKKSSIYYKLTPEIIRIRNNLSTINTALANLSYIYRSNTTTYYIGSTISRSYYKGPPVQLSVPDSTIFNDIKDLREIRLRRIYNEDLQHGGRFYSRIQNLPRSTRKTLLIDNESTCELDFDAYHINILYSLKKIIPPKQVYQLQNLNFSRKLIKKLTLISLNSSNATSTIKAFRDEAQKDPGLDRITLADLKRVIEALSIKHSPISDAFHSGIGKYLQNIDSRIAEDIMLECAKEGIPCIPVHDSFITQEKHWESLKDIMKSSYKKILKTTYVPKIRRKK